MNSSLFTLGTAQLGMEYGIANKTGKLNKKQAFRLLDEAVSLDILSFDTAYAYGTSEEILGQYFQQNQGLKPEIITKLKPLDINSHTSDKQAIQQLDESLSMSIERLKIEPIPVLLFHRYENLIWHNGFLLKYLMQNDLVKMIGVSVSTPDEAASAIVMKGVSAIQLPTNLLDLRYLNKGIFELATQYKVQIFIRSIYLQGLLFLDTKNFPSSLHEAKFLIIKLKQFCVDYKISSLKKLTFSFLKSISGNNRIVIGSETPKQIIENCNLMKSTKAMSKQLMSNLLEINTGLSDFILDPSYWRV